MRHVGVIYTDEIVSDSEQIVWGRMYGAGICVGAAFGAATRKSVCVEMQLQTFEVPSAVTVTHSTAYNKQIGSYSASDRFVIKTL